MNLYTKKQFVVDAAQFYPIQTPVICSGWVIRCTSDVLTRTDPADAMTEEHLPANISEGLTSPATVYPLLQNNQLRYSVNDPVIYVKSVSGSVTVTGVFTL